MSSILRALKKLEEEKARRRGGSVNLVHDILQGEFESTRQRRRSWSLGLLVAVLLIVGGVGGMLIMNWLSTPVSVSREQSVTSPPAPTASAAVAQPEKLPAREDVISPVGTSAPPAAGPALPTVHPEPSGGQETVPRRQATPVVAKTVPAPSRPALKVSGIVYQKDPESRMAVINDLPVMAGTDVEGARVEEILPDRVVFSFAEERFEVQLTPGN